MARRINPLIFRLGTTNIWTNQYNLLNYTANLKNFLTFKGYLNSKLNKLNQIFFTTFCKNAYNVSANVFSHFTPSFVLAVMVYSYSRRCDVPAKFYKISKKKCLYYVAQQHLVSLSLRYVIARFYDLCLRQNLLRIFFLFVYKNMALSLFNMDAQLGKSYLDKGRVVYYSVYLMFFWYLKQWFRTLRHYSGFDASRSLKDFDALGGMRSTLLDSHRSNKIRSNRVFNGCTSVNGQQKLLTLWGRLRCFEGHQGLGRNFLLTSRSQEQASLRTLSFKNYLKPGYYGSFKHREDSHFFDKMVKNFAWEGFQKYKVFVEGLFSRFLHFWSFCQQYFFRLSLKYYLLKNLGDAQQVKVLFTSLFFFTKRFSSLVSVLPRVLRISLKSYKMSYENRRKMFFIFILSLLFSNAKMFNILLVSLLPHNKNQYTVMRLVEYIINSFQLFQFNLHGIIVKVSGKFSGKFVQHKPKTQTLTFVYGRPGIPLQNLEISCKYSSIQINTRKGIFGSKTWFYVKENGGNIECPPATSSF